MMNKATLKRTGYYFFMIQLGIHLTACQSLAPKLVQDQHQSNQLKNPKQAAQVPQKVDDLNQREQKIFAWLASASEAMQAENYDEAERLYQELTAYDANNLQAEQGLLQIVNAKKHDALIEEAQVIMAEIDDKNQLDKIESALQKLHEVLLESPQHKKALAMNQSLLAQQMKLIQAKTVKKLAFNQPVTMEFRDVNIKKIFESLSKMTNINFILDKDVPSDQNATIFVKSVLFQDALDLLLQTNQLEKKVLGDNAAIIYVNDVLHQRDYKELSVRSYTLDYADAKQMTTILRSMLNMRNIETDVRLNTLIIKDTPEILQLAEKIIYAQDKPDAEVMLELQVMEIKRSYLQELGVQVPSGIKVPVSDSGVLTIGDLNKVTSKSLVVNGIPGLIFNAKDGDVNLLANPRIRVKNKDVAKIHIGEKVPVFTSNVASTGVASQTVQYIDAGLKLEVEPSVSSNDDVTIKLNLNVGSIGDKVVAVSGGNESVAFRVGTRLTSTQLRLHDGETQVLAGLIDDQDRKNVGGIPGLYKLPLLGKLFSNQTDDKVKTEIVLTITPHIIRPRTPQQAHEAEIWVGSESKAGKRTGGPRFGEGGMSPFIVPKAPAENKPANQSEAPKNINIPLPSGFSLGNGIAPTAPEAPAIKEKTE